MPRITLIGKPGCHLCDDARVVVQRVAADTGAGWQELSILDDDGFRVLLAEGPEAALLHRLDGGDQPGGDG